MKNLVITILLVVLVFALHTLTQSQTLQENLWVTDGAVRAIVSSGNNIYIGGEFTYVAPLTGHGVTIDSSTGTYNSSYPKSRRNYLCCNF
jgi:hypothetical protein